MADSKKITAFEIRSGKELIKESFRDIEDAYCHKKSVYSISTFSHGLDSLTAGLHKSDLIVIAGRPGTGKSAFVHNIISWMVTQQVPVLLCSPEMRKEMVTLRMLSINSDITCKAMECGDLGETDWPKLVAAGGDLSEVALNIDDTSPLPISDIIKIASEMKTGSRLELLAIDSLPFISTDDNRSGDAISTILIELKRLARNLKIPVILTIPLETLPSEQLKQYPCLNDIGNDLIVNYADVIIFLYKVAPANKRKGKVEALVVKNRNGELGVVPFHFSYQGLRFEEYISHQEEPVSLMH